MNNIYNEEEKKQSNLIKDLKELPKIKAPENFEFNLMTRIQNKNFGELKNEKPQFNVIKFLAPSAVVITVIILFFIFIPSTKQTNLPSVTPQENSGSTIADNSSIAAKKALTNQSNYSPSGSSQNNPGAGNLSSPQTTAPSINSRGSIKVDDFISGRNSSQRDLERGNIVNSGDKTDDSNGFFIVEKTDKKTLEKYRARIDSVKKAQMKADSLIKIQKKP